VIVRLAQLGVALALLSSVTAPAAAAPHLECPPQAPAEWDGSPGKLIGVQVLSARHGETIDDAAPPDLVPDAQRTAAGVLHSTWRMNADGPDWQFFVWCHYAGSNRILKLDAPGVKRCEYTTSATHPDRPPQQMVCN
jgi:hypothetical protein